MGIMHSFIFNLAFPQSTCDIGNDWSIGVCLWALIEGVISAHSIRWGHRLSPDWSSNDLCCSPALAQRCWQPRVYHPFLTDGAREHFGANATQWNAEHPRGRWRAWLKKPAWKAFSGPPGSRVWRNRSSWVTDYIQGNRTVDHSKLFFGYSKYRNQVS